MKLYDRFLELESDCEKLDKGIDDIVFNTPETARKALELRSSMLKEYVDITKQLVVIINRIRLELQGHTVQVLDKGWIEFQDMMGDDLAIVNGARTSFLGISKGSNKDNRLLNRLMRNYHTSPFEMVQFKFRLRAPVVVWWQWVRHRTQSYNLQSGRYTEFEENDFYVPDVWRLQSKDNKQGSDGVIVFEDIQKQLMKALIEHYERGYQLYKWALSLGVAREQARLFLPAWGSYYTGVISVNAHNLMHFLRLRMASDAQYEIRQYADVIYNEFFKVLLPVTAEAFEKYRL